MWHSSAWSKQGRWGEPLGQGRAWRLGEAGPDLMHSFLTRDLPALGVTLAGHQKKLLHNIQLLQRHLGQLGSVEV